MAYPLFSDSFKPFHVTLSKTSLPDFHKDYTFIDLPVTISVLKIYWLLQPVTDSDSIRKLMPLFYARTLHLKQIDRQNSVRGMKNAWCSEGGWKCVRSANCHCHLSWLRCGTVHSHVFLFDKKLNIKFDIVLLVRY